MRSSDQSALSRPLAVLIPLLLVSLALACPTPALAQDMSALSDVARQHSLRLSRWWQNMSERFQGADRNWLETGRRDAVYGVFVPGLIRVPDVAGK
jgi:hypothetical protein